MANKKKWLKKDLDSFKNLISSKISIAEDELEESKKIADQMLDSSQTNAIYSSHMADASGDHVELEKAYYMISRTKKYLNYLNKALTMIQEGTFGICVACNQLIPKARLEEVPHTTKCVACKEDR
ncbi:MAG: transcriptional regulator [Candidatus Marinimicrobia bacterium]|nr:transcriptional regulator [Candidatus Neomarinimicrobiota bacterium]|tara:strand:- start:23944 stop:24318 length:375 start_codon:yes stop_codon:yes gene_type:complete